MAGGRPLTGYLGLGALWTGDLSFEGRMRIDGTFRGRIYSDEVLEVGPSGLIEGEVDVAEACVAGTLDGRLRIRERLVVEPTGLVLGDLSVQHLEVRPGGTIRARITRLRRKGQAEEG